MNYRSMGPDKSMLIVLCFLLLFGNNVLSHVVQIYVPDSEIAEFYSGILNARLPGLRLHFQNGQDPGLVFTKYGQDFENYDDDDQTYGHKDAARLFYEPSVPMPKVPGKKERFRPHGTMFTRRASRATYGGYSSSPDICKIYNHNLVQLWAKLSKYVVTGTHGAPNKMALHNIALIVKAYLDHQEKSNNEEKEFTSEEKEIEPDFNVVLSKVKVILIEPIDENTVDKIADLIVDIAKPTSSNKDEVCAKRNEEKVITFVETAFKKYLDDSNCRRAKKLIFDIAIDKEIKIKETVSVENMLSDEITDLNNPKKFMRQWENDEADTCGPEVLHKLMVKLKMIIDKYLYGLHQCSVKG